LEPNGVCETELCHLSFATLFRRRAEELLNEASATSEPVVAGTLLRMATTLLAEANRATAPIEST
jgi:hypothetical protein